MRQLTLLREEIEHALRAGITHREILDLLKKDGLEDVSLETYKNALHRIRKREKKTGSIFKNKVSPQTLEARNSVPPTAKENLQPNPNEITPRLEQIPVKDIAKMSWNELKKQPVEF